jgi:SAM-dependent methyltransferase
VHMPDYESIDPSDYLGRFDHVPREQYLRDHWRPLTEVAIAQYCRGRRVLDLGCGFGDYTRDVLNAEVVVGVDLSERWLRHAQETGIRRLVRANAQQVPFRATSFDAILSVGLLEFVEPALVVGEMSRLLIPGGFCVVVSSNKYSAFRLSLRLLLWLRRRSYDRRETSLRELEVAMHANGIEPIETVMDDGLIWIPDWLDRLGGAHLYGKIESIFRTVGRNPLSNEILIVGRKHGW